VVVYIYIGLLMMINNNNNTTKKPSNTLIPTIKLCPYIYRAFNDDDDDDATKRYLSLLSLPLLSLSLPLIAYSVSYCD